MRKGRWEDHHSPGSCISVSLRTGESTLSGCAASLQVKWTENGIALKPTNSPVRPLNGTHSSQGVSRRYLGPRGGCLLEIGIRNLTMPLSREASCDRLHSHPGRNQFAKKTRSTTQEIFANTFYPGSSIKFVVLFF